MMEIRFGGAQILGSGDLADDLGGTLVSLISCIDISRLMIIVSKGICAELRGNVLRI